VKYVLDVNVLLSSLIKDSVTREIILESGLDFYFPEISYIKIIEYKNYIMKKASLNDKEFFVLLTKVMSHINFIKREDLMPYWDMAFDIMKNDEEDAIVLAAALALGKNSIILSNDKHLKKQKVVRVITTKECYSMLVD
jgi:predicted nucleic acid-binding protein